MTSLCGQTFRDFRVVVSEPTLDFDVVGSGEVQAAARVLQNHGDPIDIVKHLPRRGMAEQVPSYGGRPQRGRASRARDLKVG